jgi:gamma-glutamyl-gamma-aminobutyrate hydrolase PuuD
VVPISIRLSTGTPVARGSGRTSTLSDEYELALLRGAAERDLPVLGICRGRQALNVSRGGTLHQHLPDVTALDHLQDLEPFVPAHSVVVSPGSLLQRIAGAATLPVNSLHHRAADPMGTGLEVWRDRRPGPRRERAARHPAAQANRPSPAAISMAPSRWAANNGSR